MVKSQILHTIEIMDTTKILRRQGPKIKWFPNKQKIANFQYTLLNTTLCWCKLALTSIDTNLDYPGRVLNVCGCCAPPEFLIITIIEYRSGSLALFLLYGTPWGEEAVVHLKAKCRANRVVLKLRCTHTPYRPWKQARHFVRIILPPPWDPFLSTYWLYII